MTTSSSRSDLREEARARRASLVVVVCTSVALLAVLYLVAVHTGFGQRLDDAALRGRTRDSGVQHAVIRTLDTVSLGSLVLASVALVVIALVRRRPRLAVGIGVLVAGANISTQILKEVLTRPHLTDTAFNAVTSFPSGHSTVAMSLALALVLVVPSRLRLAAGVAGVAYAIVVGAATLTGAWHRASDVLGAYLVTLAWAGAVAAWLVASPRERPPRARSAALLDPVVALLSVLFVAGAVIAGAEVVRDAGVDHFTVGRAYVLAVVAITAGAVAALAALLAALGGAPLDPPNALSRGSRGSRGGVP